VFDWGRYQENVRCKPNCTGLGNITNIVDENCVCDEEIGYFLHYGLPYCAGTDRTGFFTCAGQYADEFFRCSDASTGTLCSEGATKDCYRSKCP
jgi:hypothetical protein